MFCNYCNKEVPVRLELVKMHHKAICLICDRYIKMANKKEVAEIESTELMDQAEAIDLMARAEKPVNYEITFTIKTTAPLPYMPVILSKIKERIECGHTSGHGSVSNNDDVYPYVFDYM